MMMNTIRMKVHVTTIVHGGRMGTKPPHSAGDARGASVKLVRSVANAKPERGSAVTRKSIRNSSECGIDGKLLST